MLLCAGARGCSRLLAERPQDLSIRSPLLLRTCRAAHTFNLPFSIYHCPCTPPHAAPIQQASFLSHAGAAIGSIARGARGWLLPSKHASLHAHLPASACTDPGIPRPSASVISKAATAPTARALVKASASASHPSPPAERQQAPLTGSATAVAAALLTQDEDTIASIVTGQGLFKEGWP